MASDQELEEIRRRVDIVDLISHYVTLKKAGANYKALCPFHEERTGSFMVSPEKQIYKCFGCFTPDTQVITKNGLKQISDIKINEIVQTHANTLDRVLHVFAREYEGDILRIKTRQTNEEIKITPDHMVFIIKTKNCKQKQRQTRLCQFNCQQSCPDKYYKDYKIEKVAIAEAKIGDMLLLPIDEQVEEQEFLTLYDRDKYLKARRTVTAGFEAKSIPEKIKIDDDLLKFFGYWIAEGSTYPRGIRFSLGSHEEDFASDIKNIAERLFNIHVGIHRRKGKSGIEISISNIHLVDIMITFCGGGAANKKIPYEFMHLPIEKQLVLIKAIARGDGTISKAYPKSLAGRESITTISQTLAQQIKNILLRSGQICVTTMKENYCVNGVSHKASWTISWMVGQKNHYSHFINDGSTRYLAVPIKSMMKEHYHGQVYNLMIENISSYVVKNFAVGNCGEGGDIFGFIMKLEALNFPEAVKFLADRSGVKLEDTFEKNPQKKDDKNKLLLINEIAAKFFQTILNDHPLGAKAKEYLKGRGISEEMIRKFRIGFAPAKKGLGDILVKRGFSEGEIAAAGKPDRFFNRIMFPIRDAMGNVIAFTGREFPDGNGPKYLNTAETVLFHKSRAMYGLDQAKMAIRQKQAVIFVEGQMDVIASQQMGVENVVASSGTALTLDHLRIMFRYAQHFILAFDNDEAGQKATEKVIEMTLRENYITDVVVLPEKFKDAGEVIEKEPELWPKLVKEAIPAVEWHFARAFNIYDTKESLNGTQKKQIAARLLPIIGQITDEVEKKHYLGKLGRRLKINEDVLRKTILTKNFDKIEMTADDEKPARKRLKLSLEEQIIASLINYPHVGKDFIDGIETKLFPKAYLTIVNELKIWYNNTEIVRDDQQKDLTSYLHQKVDDESALILNRIIDDALDPKNELDASDDYVVIEAAIRQALEHLKQNSYENQKVNFAQMIAEAEEAGDRQKVKELLKDLQVFLQNAGGKNGEKSN